MDVGVQCRLCAQYKQYYEVINVKKKEGQERNLEHKIEQCFSLSFLEITLPKHVCLQCCDKVSSSFEFYEQVIQAQDYLKPSLVDLFDDENNQNDIKPEDDFINNQSDDDFNFIDSFPQDDYNEHSFTKQQVLQQSSGDEDSDFGKPLSAIKKEVEEEKYEPSSTKKRKNKASSKKQGLETEKRYSGHSELIRRTKDEWKAYKWKCAACQEEVPSLESLRTHFEQIHNEQPRYSCMECAKVYDSYNNFKRHVATHRNKAKYQCPKCLRTFHRNMHYKDHLETHTTEKKYPCPKCGKNYKTSSSLRGHLRRHIVKPVIIPKFECTICHKKVMTRAYLIYHEKSHNGIKDFTCEECGKRFMKESNLQYHMNSAHSDEKPYSCEHCHKQFKQQKLLKTHMQVHSDDKRHACDVCGLRFHRKDTLTRHSSVHTGILAFECDYCKKRFRTKQLLKVHVRQHTGERPYACSECNRTFIDSSNYVKHMRGKHGVVTTRRDATYKIPMTQPQEIIPKVVYEEENKDFFLTEEIKPIFMHDKPFFHQDTKPMFIDNHMSVIQEQLIPQQTLNIVTTTQMVLDASRLIDK